ncbi:SpoIIE family protein phosphatase [Streptomyces sp. NBC_01497]|uniref:SpoIIE family protein phosphatase n=1 Tax=Streptomyces sp. NBC_01497 TaxID=2903885 RepID=UPI002E360E8E|nr:SpoIIE family protein phosphatase [Streptomyces sp. NBC_01497]
MFLLQLVVVLLIAVGAGLLLVYTIQHEKSENASQRALAVAEGFANAPGVATAMTSPGASEVLQPQARAAMQGADVDFVTVVDRQGIRLTSAIPSLIGRRSNQDMAPLLAGRTVQSRTTGTLSSQFRAFVPVENDDGKVVGAVGAAVRMSSVSDSVNRQLPLLLGGAAAAVAVITGGAALISRRLLRQTHGLGPTEITRMYEHHDAVLHAAREGVLIVDGDGILLLANDEAHRLLELPADARGRPVAELGLPPPMAELLVSNRTATDEVHLVGGRVLAVNQRRTGTDGGPPGSVATLRDSTELRALSGRAEAASSRLELLYDAGIGIGTTLDVRRTAEELAEVAVPQFSDFATVDLVDPVLRGDEPPGGTQYTFRRVALVGVVDTDPLFRPGARLRLAKDSPQVRGLLSGHAVLEPDLRKATSWQAQDPQRAARVVSYGIRSLISVPLNTRDAVLGVANFWRSTDSGAFEDEDLALAEELAARAAVSIDNARRYTREHDMAVALQRSLLPSALPEQSALDVAYRYLPAQKSVGGDWFDVIPLPGARVALVVGDVVGQGVAAAVTMGRLRTAVHVFSALDLPPDELLARMDELADRIDRENSAESDRGIMGATCLYAIYDPVDRRCTMARAGHLPPALVDPDGAVRFLDLPAGPPLGVGGLPFESAEVVVPEGSELVLYTDGLVEERGRDIDEGMADLAAVLSRARGEPEEVCTEVLDALLGGRAADDTALLVARTRVLPRERVARWEVPGDPAAVADVRTVAAAKLAEWGLAESGFTTELILSELVTNAIRYAAGPITVRLLLDQRLICEVTDGSGTSPHLGHAADTDEGGRGLFLVAQLAERWGTRYAEGGKIIWAEQQLPAGYAPPRGALTNPA